MITLHLVVAWCAVIGTGIAGAWALLANFVPAVRGKPMWWFMALAQGLMIVQVVLGVILLAGLDYEAHERHVFYGFLTFIAIGIIYAYRQQMEHKLFLLYGLGTLFVMGLGIRAMSFAL
ncbi:MAG: hypothetical protein R2770_14630 [Acidimicrobiales bacterium]|nr:hypothetical protein [Acidimicrobiales bacterium]